MIKENAEFQLEIDENKDFFFSSKLIDGLNSCAPWNSVDSRLKTPV